MDVHVSTGIAVSRDRTARFALAVIAVIAPYVLLAAYAHPGADDFTYAVDTLRDGYWTSIRDQYLLWNGRFTSNFLELGGPMVWQSIGLYRAVAAAMIVATVAASWVVVHAVARDAWTTGQTFAAALCLAALDLHGLPALAENIYWYTGSVTYQLSAILLVLQIAVTVRALRAARALSSWTLAAALLAVAIAGMNEVAMLLELALYTTVAVVSYLDNRRALVAPASFLLAATIAGGVLVAVAPGNAVRSSLYPVRHELLRSLALTGLQTIRFAVEWTTSGTLLLASLLYLPLGAELARTPPFRTITPRATIALALAPFATIPIAVLPAYWATGLLGQHRTVSVAYFVFLVLWFAALTAAFAREWLPRSTLDRRAQAVLTTLLVLALAVTGNGYRVAVDFARGRPAIFDREMSARYASLRACAADARSECIVPALSVLPDALFAFDLSPDSNHWVNVGYAMYFKVPRVVAVGPR